MGGGPLGMAFFALLHPPWEMLRFPSIERSLAFWSNNTQNGRWSPTRIIKFTLELEGCQKITELGAIRAKAVGNGYNRIACVVVRGRRARCQNVDWLDWLTPPKWNGKTAQENCTAPFARRTCFSRSVVVDGRQHARMGNGSRETNEMNVTRLHCVQHLRDQQRRVK